MRMSGQATAVVWRISGHLHSTGRLPHQSLSFESAVRCVPIPLSIRASIIKQTMENVLLVRCTSGNVTGSTSTVAGHNVLRVDVIRKRMLAYNLAHDRSLGVGLLMRGAGA